MKVYVLAAILHELFMMPPESMFGSIANFIPPARHFVPGMYRWGILVLT